MRLDSVEEHTFGMFVKKQAVYVVLEYVAREQRNGYGLTQGVSGARALDPIISSGDSFIN
jgi:hypothetical protein